MSDNNIGNAGSDRFGWNCVFTWASAIKELSEIKKGHDNAYLSWENTCRLIFGALKFLPFVGNIVYLAQKGVRWLQDQLNRTDEKTQIVSTNTLPSSQLSSLPVNEKPLEQPKELEKTEPNPVKEAPTPATIEDLGLDKYYADLASNPHVRHRLLKTLKLIDIQFDKLDESSKQEFAYKLASLYENHFFGCTPTALELWDYLLEKRGPESLYDLIRTSDLANYYGESEHWLKWTLEKAPQALDTCLTKHPDPFKLILTDDPTKGALWKYVKNNSTLLKTLTELDSSTAPRPLLFKVNLETAITLLDVFESSDDIFIPILKIMQREKQGTLLKYFIDNMQHAGIRSFVQLAANYKDRFNAFIQAEAPAFVTVFATSQQSDFYITLNNLMDFSDIWGDGVLKVMKANKELNDELFASLSNPVTSDLRLRIWKSLHRYDPVRFRNEALELATTHQPNPLNFVDIVLQMEDKDYEALEWLMKSDARLFIQLVGKSQNFDKENSPSFPLERILRLDPDHFPTAEELAQFLSRLNLALHIPETSPEKLESIHALFKAINISHAENVKIILQDPALSIRPSSAVATVNKSLLECFGVSDEEFDKMSKTEANELLGFINTGACTLKNVSKMCGYLKYYKALDYASAEKKPVNDPKRNFTIIWKIGDQIFDVEVHKAILSGITDVLDDWIDKDAEEVTDAICQIEHMPNFTPSAIPLFLDLLYGKKSIAVEPISNIDELHSLLYLTDLFKLEGWLEDLTHMQCSICQQDPSYMAKMSLDDRVNLFYRIVNLKDDRLYFEINLLAGMHPKERKDFIVWIMTELKLATPVSTVDGKPQEDESINALFINIMKQAFEEMHAEEIQEILLMIKGLNRFQLFKNLLELQKQPFSLLVQAEKDLALFKWYVNNDPEGIHDLMNQETQAMPRYTPILLTLDAQYRDSFYTFLMENSSSIGMYTIHGLLDLFIEDIHNEKVKELLVSFLETHKFSAYNGCIRESALSDPQKLKAFTALDKGELVTTFIKELDFVNNSKKAEMELKCIKEHFPDIFDTVATDEQKEIAE